MKKLLKNCPTNNHVTNSFRVSNEFLVNVSNFVYVFTRFHVKFELNYPGILFEYSILKNVSNFWKISHELREINELV